MRREGRAIFVFVNLFVCCYKYGYLLLVNYYFKRPRRSVALQERDKNGGPRSVVSALLFHASAAI